MALPVVALARSSVVIGGERIEFRALSRAEAMELNAYKGREGEAEVFILVAGVGCSEDEAQAFRAENDLDTAGLLIDAILVLSKLAEADEDTDPKRRGKKPS